VEVRFDLTRSIPRNSNAAHIKPNPTTFPDDIFSLNRNTPSKKKIVGVMYWSNPKVESGNRTIAPLKSNRGITVAAPARQRSAVTIIPCPNCAVPFPSI
jgi:hypothetical protein